MVDDEIRGRLEEALKDARLAVAEAQRRGSWSTDPLLTAGMAKLVENVAESLGHMPQEGTDRFPDVPWEKIRGMRNRIVHDYTRLDVPILRSTVENDLPQLVRHIERMLEKLSPAPADGEPPHHR